jgi:hypothetical protein
MIARQVDIRLLRLAALCSCFCANLQAAELRAAARPAEDQLEQHTVQWSLWLQAFVWACAAAR